MPFFFFILELCLCHIKASGSGWLTIYFFFLSEARKMCLPARLCECVSVLTQREMPSAAEVLLPSAEFVVFFEKNIAHKFVWPHSVRTLK